MGLTAATAGVDQTRALAAAVSVLARAGDLVLLAGELGAGKTAFAQGFAAGLGVDEAVTSPTFTLVRTYPGGRLTMNHVDVYRLERLQEAVDLGLAEMADDPAVTLIEWGDVVIPALPTDFLEVCMAYGDDGEDHRSLSLKSVGRPWAARERALNDALAPWLVVPQ
ncbi:MAG: tRNA (adenosine(37)-N6)-threonylcarbamoyltransferase complex ATPase subunit type 1 TsaE [Actinomycetota bacterium]|nr:tRNA (adenosine(37)-N6)-threonylcarbamoyltransferase complex ATPase subunit type 1 TsaE [Actinomycetota bacterium]